MSGTGQADADQGMLARIVLRAPVLTGRAAAQVGGPRLRELRRARGLTQKKLAVRAGISYATVSRMEGEPVTSCRQRTAARLALALGAHPAALRPEPGPARAAAAAPAVASLSAALAASGVDATVTATPAGAQITAAATPANVAALIDALILALNIAGETGP
ncbi:MAG TPA: helix-turn-helix transcriptional regulator [Streptosporangiaceae bacterium]|nr:helix-turn-helix transcriptional regulator [Streptosporangiaceae bacterium]